MPIPQLLNDVISLLLLLAPSAALLSMVLAGMALRHDGTAALAIGGKFTKWMFWAVVFLTLQPLLTWFSSFGIALPLPSGGISTPWLSNIQTDIASFVTNFIVGRLVDVPTEPLDACEQAIVEQALTRVQFDGIRYSLVGASGSAKKGKFYAVDSNHERRLAERFRFSPQAAMTYFGILVSSCKVLVEVPECRLLVVDDHQLGTNDCRGWISQSLFRRLQAKHRQELVTQEMQRLLAKKKEKEDFSLEGDKQRAICDLAERKISRKLLRSHRFYQFRLAFDKTQAKGSFKVMADELAEALEADIILPKSSVKPKYQGGVLRTIRSILGDRQAHAYRGTVLVGIRDISRDLQFQSSYTLVEHAPEDSIELEIKPYALQEIERLRKAWEENNFTELFELLGTQETQRVVETGEKPDSCSQASSESVRRSLFGHFRRILLEMQS